MSVGEWPNSVIEVVDEENGELTPSTGFDRCSDDCSRQSVRCDDRWHRDADRRDREANAQRRQSFRAEEPEQDHPYRDADWRNRACMEETEVPVHRQDRPYREGRRGEASNSCRSKPGHYAKKAIKPPQSRSSARQARSEQSVAPER